MSRSLLRVLVVLLLLFNLIFLSNLISRYSPFTPLSTKNLNSKALSQSLLRLNTRNEFSIAIFSDLHYGENEDSFGITQDIASTKVMNRILDFEKPDFVVISKSSPSYQFKCRV